MSMTRNDCKDNIKLWFPDMLIIVFTFARAVLNGFQACPVLQTGLPCWAVRGRGREQGAPSQPCAEPKHRPHSPEICMLRKPRIHTLQTHWHLPWTLRYFTAFCPAHSPYSGTLYLICSAGHNLGIWTFTSVNKCYGQMYTLNAQDMDHNQHTVIKWWKLLYLLVFPSFTFFLH